MFKVEIITVHLFTTYDEVKCIKTILQRLGKRETSTLL